jgi:iron-sulfur cluster assembly accessory protein
MHGQPVSRNVKRSFVQKCTQKKPAATHACSILSPQRSFVTVTKTSPSINSPSPEIITQNTNSENQSSVDNLVQQDNDAIIITGSAVQQINHLANLKRPQEPDQMYLRVYVDAGGCSGFQYKFELENKDDEDAIDDEEDIIIHCVDKSDNAEACVVIDEASLELLEGSKIDFVREMIRSSFAVVSNPQSESACGCGSSFAVKNFEKHGALD